MAEMNEEILEEAVEKEKTAEATEPDMDGAEDTEAGEEMREDQSEARDAAETDEADENADKDDDETPEQDADRESDEKSGDKKGFFKKKKDKRDEQIEELSDKLKRQMAEFDNFRKRTEKEKSQMYDMGARSVIEKILPVIDNFERGLAAVPEEAKEDAFVVGMDKVYKQMLAELEAIGVTAIEAVGQEFDPEFHNAVMQVESGEYESGVVAQELQKGYMYKDSVVRHSMVAVVS